MTNKPTSLSRKFLVWATFFGLALRSLIPVGYMPSSLETGLPFVLCPSAGAGELLASLGGSHNSHHGDVDSEHASAEYCPLGMALNAVALVAVATAEALEGAPPILTAASLPIIAVAAVTPYGARAPPTLQSSKT